MFDQKELGNWFVNTLLFMKKKKTEFESSNVTLKNLCFRED